MNNKIFNISMFIITLIFFVVMICYSITSQNDLPSNSDTINDTISDTICDSSYYDISSFTKINGKYFNIYVHNYTGVCYAHTSYGGFIPLYNSDGSLLIYSN